MTLPQRDYGDPLEVLLAKEEESCKGCRYRVTEPGFTMAICGNPLSKRIRADVRCDLYEERV